MAIKTAVSLATGAAVGFLFGLSINEKEKEKIVSNIRGKIFFALTGEKIPKKKQPVFYNAYKVNYSDFNKPKQNDLDYKGLFEFDSLEDGEDFIKYVKEMARNYKIVSLLDIMSLLDIKDIYGHGKCKCDNLRDYFDYGWTEEDIENWIVCKRPDSVIINRKQYWIPVSDPKKLNV